MLPVQFTIPELLEATGGRLLRGTTDGGVAGISTDTRTVQTGQAFLAIRGPRYDGHQFVQAALARGAAALIVAEADAARLNDCTIPVVAVADTVRAFGAIARLHRRRFTMPVVAITGSCGKTTTKEYLATLLGHRGAILKSPSTENNAIGVPRALLQLAPHHACAVIELGSNHPGEIAALRDVVEPTHAVVVNIGPAHLEFFRTIDTVAREKLSLLETVPASGGIVLHAEDPWMERWCAEHQASARPNVRTFGWTPQAHVWGSLPQQDEDGIRFVINGTYPARLPTLGVHHAMDALAALAAAEQLGGTLEELVPHLTECRALAWRMEPVRLPGGPTLLCDCYNANPLSMAQAIQTLARYPQARRRLLVTGEMRELGAFTTEAHCTVGRWAMMANLDGLIAIGPHASLVLAGAHATAKQAMLLMGYQTVEEACARVPALLGADDVVLIKGSRSARLEQLVASCREQWTPHAVLAE